jgi:hypothetical protein
MSITIPMRCVASLDDVDVHTGVGGGGCVWPELGTHWLHGTNSKLLVSEFAKIRYR